MGLGGMNGLRVCNASALRARDHCQSTTHGGMNGLRVCNEEFGAKCKSLYSRRAARELRVVYLEYMMMFVTTFAGD